ncbi:MAG: NAD(+)/NADH kinase [Bacteroidales bacterium]|jgi:NAD+ kinase|nr:NAD(+)/NADH kinase [Bacteroidales bacterium]
MKIGFFGNINIQDGKFSKLLDFLRVNDCDYQIINEVKSLKKNDFDFIFSLGGDGTLLDCASLVADSEIPIMGINFGSLGFLPSIEPEHISEALTALLNGNYAIEDRNLLQIQSEDEISKPFALNEVSVFRDSFGQILQLDVFVDTVFLNRYKGDGLLISTPTGSTAYNLSCGGPILMPHLENIIITAVASHTLTVRPVILDSKSKVEIVLIQPKHGCLNVGLDSKMYKMQKSKSICITKADFSIKLLKFPEKTFFNTLRKKLNWGL